MQQIRTLDCKIPTSTLLRALTSELSAAPGFALVRAAPGYGDCHPACAACTLVYLEPHAKLLAKVDSIQTDNLVNSTSQFINGNFSDTWSNYLDQFIAQYGIDHDCEDLPAPILAAITYEAGTTFERIAALAPQTELACAYAYARVLVLPDDQSKPLLLACFQPMRHSDDEFVAWLEQISKQKPPCAAAPNAAAIESRNFSAELPLNTYIENVEIIRGAITRGEVYQVNLTQRIQIAAPTNDYRRIISIFDREPANHAFVLRIDHQRIILSASPELFLTRQDERIVSEPIKGTCRRHEDKLRDAELCAALLESEKDHAELAMIVDLIRNDLARVALKGSVTVEAHRELMKLPYVYHLFSRVTARVSAQVKLSQILGATFPCGSITGAPKIAAMQMINRLEKSARGYYCGALGYIKNQRCFSLNVAIRSGVVSPEGFTFGVGGGVVFDSEGAAEHAECIAKAQVFLRN